MLFVVLKKDKANHEHVRAEVRPAHLEFLNANKDKVALGGPLMSDDGTRMIGSMIAWKRRARPRPSAAGRTTRSPSGPVRERGSTALEMGLQGPRRLTQPPLKSVKKAALHERGLFHWASAGPAVSSKNFAVLFYVAGKAERVLAHQAFGQVRVALLDGRDDLGVIHDGALRAVVLADGQLAHAAHVRKQALSGFCYQLAARHADDLLVKGKVCLRIFGDEFLRVAIGEGLDILAQLADLGLARLRAGEPRGHAFQRAPHGDHFQDFLLRLADDENAPARHGAHEASCSSSVMASRMGVREKPSFSESWTLLQADLLGVAVMSISMMAALSAL